MDVVALRAAGLTLALLGAAIVMALPGAAESASSESVTMSFTRFYDNACRCYKARVSGQVSSGRAGEYVVVLRQYCPLKFGTAVAGATTRDGGFWETEISPVAAPELPASETYRARWEGRVSSPVTLRRKLLVQGWRARGTTQRITVYAGGTNPVDLRRRTVVLQRRSAGGWTRVASGHLTPDPSLPNGFLALLKAPRRGLTVRALVPAKSAAPCFPASPSATWTS